MFKASLLTRMAIVKNRLMKERGIDINSVHMLWSEGNWTPEQKTEVACKVLEAYLDGKCTPANLNDRTENV